MPTDLSAVCFPNGERVDCIQSAGAAPTPGGPSWNVIPEYDDAGNPQWRPNNVYVDQRSWPLYESGACIRSSFPRTESPPIDPTRRAALVIAHGRVPG